MRVLGYSTMGKDELLPALPAPPVEGLDTGSYLNVHDSLAGLIGL